jgi:hypothetical protein
VIKTYDPTKVTITFNGKAIVGFADGDFIEARSWTFDSSSEEIGVVEIMTGDVITHVKGPTSGKWVPVQSNGGDCVGWLISDEDSYYLYGHILFADGKKGGRRALITKAYCANTYRVTRLKQKAAAPSGRWNGKCGKCGRGTYTGFTSFEHDGPCQ